MAKETYNPTIPHVQKEPEAGSNSLWRCRLVAIGEKTFYRITPLRKFLKWWLSYSDCCLNSIFEFIRRWVYSRRLQDDNEAFVWFFKKSFKVFAHKCGLLLISVYLFFLVEPITSRRCWNKDTRRWKHTHSHLNSITSCRCTIISKGWVPCETSVRVYLRLRFLTNTKSLSTIITRHQVSRIMPICISLFWRPQNLNKQLRLSVDRSSCWLESLFCWLFMIIVLITLFQILEFMFRQTNLL